MAVISEPSWSRASIWGAAAPLAGTCAASSTPESLPVARNADSLLGFRQLHDDDNNDTVAGPASG